MNIAITLPHRFVQAIIDGEKTIEMRKSYPKHCYAGEDGFFVIEKGTDNIICWCRVNTFFVIDTSLDCLVELQYDNWGSKICVSRKEFFDYCKKSSEIYLWFIDKVKIFSKPLHKEDLIIDKNPQSYCYTPLSYGESF